MKVFEVGKEVLAAEINNEDWIFRITRVYSPSQQEIEKNAAHNDELGDWEPENELPTSAHIQLAGKSQSGEIVELWFSPEHRQLGPHVSKKGWSRGLLSRIKTELCNWKIS